MRLRELFFGRIGGRRHCQIFATQFFVMGLLGNWLPDLPAPTWMGAAEIARLQSRLTFGGIATIFAVAVGYTCFAFVSIAEGRRYFRVRAEMALAAEIHRVLVPTIDIKSDGFSSFTDAPCRVAK